MARGGIDLRMAEQALRPAPKAASVCALVRAETKPGRADQFEALLGDFAFQVRGEERGCVSYVVTRLLGSDTHFAVHARFASWRSFQRHALTAHMKRALPRLTALLATPISLEIFLEA